MVKLLSNSAKNRLNALALKTENTNRKKLQSTRRDDAIRKFSLIFTLIKKKISKKIGEKTNDYYILIMEILMLNNESFFLNSNSPLLIINV